MNNPYLSTVNWTAISTATGFAISFVVTTLAVCLLPKVFPRLRRPEVSFWVMLCIFMATFLGSVLILTPLQVHNQSHNRTQAAHVP